ncbi:flagellar motor protein MotB [Chitinasiproducens palmae]|uniref:Chemotaxis protein MotB n=1 Tax=Chitinasiproducens palmae TaxID=1770053 RepID=A0A1H2PKJ1_9BURK|nr:flagellar motor protein MotB [Chitinasiproducens palmae]SDV46962.1 chemotaxis protein MotB [Chitinasiproducens palmae]
MSDVQPDKNARRVEAAHASTTVIRRVRREHDASHGGAWKVAFADFTLAMMALFMVLWVLGSANTAQRQTIADAFRGKLHTTGADGLFDKASRRPAPLSAAGQRERDPDTEADALHRAEWSQRMQRVAERVQREASARGMSDNVDVLVGPNSLRISIHDAGETGMFARRSDVMHPVFVELLHALVPVLQTVPEPLLLLGHTDATPFAAPGVWSNNWALSSRRALRAREILLRAGLPEARLYQVAGMGASQPAIKRDPNHARNRRIELVLVGERTHASWQAILDAHGIGETAALDANADALAVPAP